MTTQKLSNGTVHALPSDVTAEISSNEGVVNLWEDLTPLARNEWICWIEDAKKAETRCKRTARLIEDLKAGKRRPCCWLGCPHRKTKSVKGK